VKFVRSWRLLIIVALAAGVAGAAFVGVGPKIAAEPELHRQILFNQITIFGAIAWLLLAVFRFLLLKWEKRR
jgi:hypothetical protein